MRTIPEVTDEDVAAMREWAKDCTWADYAPEDIDELTRAKLIRGVDRHYDGGIMAFLRDAAPVTV